MTQMSLPRNPEQKGLIPGRALPGEAIGHREVVVTLELGHSWVGVTGSRDSHWSWGHAGAGVTVEPGSRRSGGHSGAGVPGEWGVTAERGSQKSGGCSGEGIPGGRGVPGELGSQRSGGHAQAWHPAGSLSGRHTGGCRPAAEGTASDLCFQSGESTAGGIFCEMAAAHSLHPRNLVRTAPWTVDRGPWTVDSHPVG